MSAHNRIYVCCIILAFFTCGNAGNPVIRTRHFEITYPQYLSQQAVNIAYDAESVFSRMTDLLEYQPDERIKLDLTDMESTFFFPDIPCDPRNNTTDSHKSCCGIYSMVYEAFIRQYSGSLNPGFFNRIISRDRIILSIHLKEYIRSGIDDNAVMMLNDYYLSNPGTAIKIDTITFSDGYPDYLFMKFFLGYIENEFGRNVFACTLRDMFFYGDYMTAVSRITGKDVSVISEGYNTYIARYRRTPADEQFKTALTGYSLTDSVITAQCGDRNTREMAFLLKKDDRYGVLLCDYTSGITGTIPLPHIIEYNSISMEAGKIIICGKNTAGAVLLCINMAGKYFEWEREFPYVAIESAILISDESKLYLVIRDRETKSIFSYNCISGSMSRISDSLCCYDPSITSSGRIIYINRDNAFSIMEFNPASGENHEIYRTTNALFSPVELSEGKAVFTERKDGVSNICSIDYLTGKREQYTHSITSDKMPVIITDRIYFLHYRNKLYNPVYISISSE